MKPTTCYRFVNEDMTSKQDEKTKWKIGEWNKINGKIECCKNGFHASLTPLQSLNNVYGNKWFIAEFRGKTDKQTDKFCASEMKLTKEIPIEVLKRFAIWCAKDCLINFEKEYPNDKRPVEAIQAAEDYLDGKIDIKELNNKVSAAWAAAWAAARADAAWVAAGAAEAAADAAAWAAGAARAARAAADAAWVAAGAAEAAGAAARKRQNKELLKLIKEATK